MKFKVTQAHIDAGVRMDRLCCPMALALFEATGDVWSVRARSLVNRKKGKQYHLSFSDPISLFIDAFDHNESPLPGEFEIRNACLEKVEED